MESSPWFDQSNLIADAEKAARCLSTHFLNHHCHHHRCHHTFQWFHYRFIGFITLSVVPLPFRWFHYHFGGSTTVSVIPLQLRWFDKYWQLLTKGGVGSSNPPSWLPLSNIIVIITCQRLTSPLWSLLCRVFCFYCPRMPEGGRGGDQFNQSTGWLISSVKQKISSVKGSLSSFYRHCKSLGT